jgi:hypothetical protein
METSASFEARYAPSSYPTFLYFGERIATRWEIASWVIDAISPLYVGDVEAFALFLAFAVHPWMARVKKALSEIC